MNIKIRIAILQFLQFFIWGSWLISLSVYWLNTKHWSATNFGEVFSTMGVAGLFMPTIAGIIADRWVNAERLYGYFHLASAIIFAMLPLINNPDTMINVMLLNMLFYMPTLSLSYTISYAVMERAQLNIIKYFPMLRSFGTVGFIIAMWLISWKNLEASEGQFYIASITATLLGIMAFTLPKCPPLNKSKGNSIINALGLNAFKLLKNRKMALFFFFHLCLGVCLQLSNAYGATFLKNFANIPQYKDSMVVTHSLLFMSISQISEAIFIITIPVFMRHLGIKKIMTISMLAWVLRFGLFAYGNPGDGLWMILFSCIIYGMAFDFFNISSSLFIETQVVPSIRASAQGMLMSMSNGIGSIVGSLTSGWMIDNYFRVSGTLAYDWTGIWSIFSLYSLIVAIIFVIIFKHKHNRAELEHFHGH